MVFLVPPIGQSVRLKYMAVPSVIKMNVKCDLWYNMQGYVFHQADGIQRWSAVFGHHL